jgi:hypothetical protein
VSQGLVWWTPGLGASLVTLSVRVADLQVRPERQGYAAQTLAGSVVHATLGQADRVVVELSAALETTSDTTEREVRDLVGSLADHLLRGEPIGLAGRASTAWAARLGAGVLGSPGDTTFSAASALTAATGSVSLSAGDRLVLRALGGARQREEGYVASRAFSVHTLQRGTLTGLSGGAVVRERYTYPALRLSEARASDLVPSRRGVTYSLRAELVQDTELEATLLQQVGAGALLVDALRTRATQVSRATTGYPQRWTS